MADGDGAGVKELVEGFAREGKPLDRITKAQTLQEIQRQIKRKEVEINTRLQKEQAALAELQHKLNSYNEQYAQQKQQLDDLRSEQTVQLDGDQKGRIERLTREAIDAFVAKRPRNEDEQVTVDVHFLPGVETIGFNLQIGGEGAGSRDAKFLVYLNQTVQALATQAAKYWGLDADKVFFLDRDSRIVPDNMRLSDIILPPVQSRRAAASAESPAPAASSAVVPYTGGAAAGAAEELWTVRGRNYSLTLVRAGTVLSKEDLNRPKGERWEDFTFNEIELNRELENTRKKYADHDMEAGGMNMDLIPSLYDLIQQGQEKKRRRRADTWCRVAEFAIFLICAALFYALLIRDDRRSFVLYLGNALIVRELTAFAPAEQLAAGVATFGEVSTPAQYATWALGPLQRNLVLQPGPTPLQQHGLFVLTAVGDSYQPPAANPPAGVNWCPALPSVTSNLTGTTATSAPPNGTGATTTTTTAATTGGSTTTTAGNASVANASNRSVAAVAPAPGPVCVPPQLQPCLNLRVIATFASALLQGEQVPACRPTLGTPELATCFSGFAEGKEFSFVRGRVNAYSGGERATLSLTNATEFARSADPLLPKAGVLRSVAQMVSVFVYSPPANCLFVVHLLAEQTMSGSIVTTVKSSMVNLSQSSDGVYTQHFMAVLFAAACFLMEVRRILGCPRRVSFEDERDRCSCWTLLFLLLPLLLFVIAVLVAVRYSQDADTVAAASATGAFDSQAMRLAYNLQQQDTYTLALVLIALVIINALFFRYLLMYFPQLTFVTSMVQKLVRPLASTYMFLVLAFLVFGATFFAMYSTQVLTFSDLIGTSLEMIRFAQGRFDSWYGLYQRYTTLWTVVVSIAFVLVTLILNNLAAAIMLSHKREKDLFENYSYHPCWASERSKGNGDPRDFNPATVGWDFRGKEPRPP